MLGCWSLQSIDLIRKKLLALANLTALWNIRIRSLSSSSSANCATRRMAEFRSELFSVMLLLLSLGRTASKLGTVP